MSTQQKFGTAINCTDGRIQMQIINWIKENYNVDFVDLVTENGPSKFFIDEEKVKEIKNKVYLSIKQDNSKIIAISGHHDCIENPVTKDEHISQI